MTAASRCDPATRGRLSTVTSARDAPLIWLDALKGIAILAVVFDHTFLVNDYLVWKHSYFAVSWFIALAGVSNTLSARQRDFRPWPQSWGFWCRRCQALLGPYLWVTAATYLLLDVQGLSPEDLVRRLLLANSQPQLYFVPLLLQLLLVFPLFYWAIYRTGWLTRTVLICGALLLAPVIVRRISFPWTLGAHYFLGGSFLYLFLLGMLVAPILRSPGRWLWPLVAASLAMVVAGEYAVQRSGGTIMTHPPSQPMIVYVLGLLGVGYALCRTWPRALPVRLAAWLGRRSLDIFLYHYAFLLPILPFRDPVRAQRLPIAHAQLVVVAVAIPVVIAGSLAAASLSRGLYRRLDAALRAAVVWYVGGRNQDAAAGYAVVAAGGKGSADLYGGSWGGATRRPAMKAPTPARARWRHAQAARRVRSDRPVA
jgi:peptidoglycan/LPS O-acetylase OafA/YrhL